MKEKIKNITFKILSSIMIIFAIVFPIIIKEKSDPIITGFMWFMAGMLTIITFFADEKDKKKGDEKH